MRQIHPEDSYQDSRSRFTNRSQEDDRYGNRYYSDRQDVSQRQNNDNNRNDYRRNDSYDSSREEDRQNNYRRDDRNNRDQDYSPPGENGHRQQYRGGRYQENRKHNNRPPNKKFNKTKVARQFQHDFQRENSDFNEAGRPQYEHGEASGSSIQNCYICRKNGHYANQCPTRDKGKAPAINMVAPEIQQVTS